jgi:8-oxo-dGTP pyrophosphatase MutT (NUDIX family)
LKSQPSEDLESQEKVVAALVELPQGQDLAEALIAGRNFLHLIRADEVTGVREIRVREGHGPQNLDDEGIDTHFHAYLEAVINPQIRAGTIADGTRPGDHDDRKIRWSGAGVAGFWSRSQDLLTLEVGPTSYPRYRLDLARSPLEIFKLMARGLETYQDPYAYFARGVGVAVVPLTPDGTVYIGERSAQVDLTGVLNFVAGWATFSPNVEEINFYADAQRELWEEVGVAMTLDGSNTRFIGISGNPMTGEADLVFVVQTEMPDRHFQSGQWEEHSRWVCIRNKSEAENLLEQGILPGEKEPRSLMFSSRLGLEYLVQNHW